METPVLIAIVAGVQVILLTLVQSYVVARKERRDAEIRRQEKAEDYRRQDEVAARVAATAIRTEAANARIQAQLTQTLEQGKKIHILVNSDMTAARTAERDSLKLLLLALRRISVTSGRAASHTEEDEMAKVEERIAELNQILADRLAAQARVDSEDRNEA